MSGDRPRYSVVECTVRAHAHYGLLVRSSDGDDGFVDSDDIADQPLASEHWPAVGETLWGVVLGYTVEGRVRVCTSPSYVALARSTDMADAMRSWQDVRDPDDRGAAAVREFLVRADAGAVLRWALTGRYHATDRAAAVRLIALAPEELRARLPPDVLTMARRSR